MLISTQVLFLLRDGFVYSMVALTPAHCSLKSLKQAQSCDYCVTAILPHGICDLS